MSQENVETVRRAYAAIQRGDIEEFIRYFDPEVEFKSLFREMEGTVYGHDGIREWWAGVLDAFPDFKPTMIGIRDLGGWVMIHVRTHGQGAGSGLVVDEDYWQAVHFRNGRVVRYAVFRTEAEALAAAGLTE